MCNDQENGATNDSTAANFNVRDHLFLLSDTPAWADVLSFAYMILLVFAGFVINFFVGWILIASRPSSFDLLRINMAISDMVGSVLILGSRPLRYMVKKCFRLEKNWIN